MIADFPPDRSVRLVQERKEVPELSRRFQELIPDNQLAAVATCPEYCTWAFCEWLLDTSLEQRFNDAAQTFHFAELGISVALHLNPQLYGQQHVADLQGRAWAYLSNALRLQSDYERAAEVFREAEEALAKGTKDPLVIAHIRYVQAFLPLAQGQWQHAIELFEEVIRLYETAGDERAAAAVMPDIALAYGFSGNREMAISVLRRSLSALEAEQEETRVLYAKQNLAGFLQEQGELREAASLLREIYPRFVELADHLNIARTRWIEGRVLLSMNQLIAAEDAFLEAQRTFVDQNIAFDAAQVSLDLATIYARQERSETMFTLAVQMMPIFRSGKMHYHAQSALMVFHKAVQTKEINERLIQRIRAFLQKSQYNPKLRFRARL